MTGRIDRQALPRNTGRAAPRPPHDPAAPTKRRRRRFAAGPGERTLHLVALLALVAGTGAAQLPEGEAFLVTNGTAGYQKNVAVASRPDSGFAIVWQDDRAGGYDIYGRAFDDQGTAIGSSFRVHDDPTGSQSYPDVAVGAGGYLVVWTELDAVRSRALDPAGHPVGADRTVNSAAADSPFNATVGSGSSGESLVVWSEVSTPPNAALWARLLDSSGVPQGTQFQVQPSSAGQASPRIATSAAGFWVIWNESPQANSFEIHARQISASGVPVAASLRVDDAGTDDSLLPSISAGGEGGFVATWWDRSGADTIRARRFDSNGAPIGVTMPVASGAGRSRTTSDGAAGWHVVWGGGPGVRGSHLTRDLQPGSPPFVVSPENYDYGPAIASRGAGDFVVAWTSNPPDYSVVDYNVYARRYFGLFRDDFESGTVNAWSLSVP